MLQNLNKKYHVFFSNNVFKAAMVCTTSVPVCITLPNDTRKEIVHLVTGACSPNPMIVTGENQSTRCHLIHLKP